MAEKVILTDKYKKPYMPITRGELVLDSSGNPAFTSEAFLATPRHHGLLSATDKKKIDDITNTSYTLSGGLIENNYQVVLKSNDVNTSQATISSMVGASIITDENNNEVIKAGSAGLVPAPTDINTFLKGDGTWSVIKPTTSSKSKNVTDKGWYRIAISKSSILRCLGTFEIEGSVSGCHTVTTVLSGINYGENPFITVLNTSHFVNAAITKVRIVYHTTYTNNYAYVEVYKDTTTSTSLTIKLADGYGWSLCDITTGSVPTNYTYKEMPLDNATLSTTGRIITNGIKSTTGEFTGNVYSNAIYNGSKIYATRHEIIHADSNYFELNKGYPDSIMWFNASEYKFKIGSNILFMIASNGNVGIGNVGGAPAYKLHVGGGEVMADTYHAWSGGFKKNGSSDSYVLLGGGGHKAISDFLTSLPSHTHDYLPLSGGTMTSTANISWTDRGAWGNASATYPYSYGGLSWSGTSDWIKIYAKEAGSDALNLVFDFGDDSGHYITFRDNGTEYTMLHSGNYSSVIDSYYIPSQSMMNSAYATIPTYNGETGWHRIATIKGSVGYGSYILYLCGNWSWASNTNAIIHIDTMHTTAQLTQVSGIVGYVTHIRLVNVSNNEYYVDVYINYSGSNTPGTVYCYFLGNGTITPRTTVEKITSAVTASAELTLADGGFSNASRALKDSNNGNNITACYSTGGFSSNPSWLAAWNGYHLTYVSPSVLSVNYATSAGNADTVDGYHATRGDNKPWGTIPVITTSGWMEVGKHFEFHYDNTTGSDYSTVLTCTGNHSNVVNLPSASGTLALTSQIPTVTNYYWANVSVSASSNAYTTPQFGKVTIYDGTDSILSLKTKTAGAYAYLAAYNTGGQYGADIVLHSGSALVLGAGESAASMYSNNVDSLQGSENLYLTADGAVKIFTNCASIANRKATAFFNTDGSVNIYGHLYTDQPSTNRRAGIIGTYDPNRAAAIWSMGSSYQIAADGTTFGNLYGAAYAYYGSGYTFGAGKSGGHSLVWCQAGTPYVALGNNIWTSGYIETGSYLTFGSYGARFTSDIRSSWRTSIYGNTTNNSRIRPVRTDISIDNFSEIYGSGLTWATADTQGYLSVSYSSGQAWIGGGSGNALNWSTYLVTGKNIGSQSVNYANSAGSAKTHSGYSRTITVNGSSDTYYPVVINTTYSKNLPNIVTIWKNLGSTTASYSGNHSDGTSSCLYRYDVRISLWDGNGGYCKCLNAWYGYAPLVAHTEFTYTSVGQLCIWLRGGGTTYEISSTWDASATVYYSRTDLHGGDYPCIVEPRTSIGNGGRYSTAYLGYGDIYGNATTATTATTASKVTCTEAFGDTPRPIVGVVNNSLYYTSKVTIRWDNGNVTAPTFTGRLIGSADKVNGYTIWTGTQTLYNSATKNNNTIYLIY